MSLTGLAVGLLALYVAIGVFLVMPRMTADGTSYYAQSRSLILDGDGDLADEYRFDEELVSPLGVSGPREWLPRDYDGRFRHYANVGIVMLFAPFIMLGHLISVGMDQAGIVISTDGYDRPYLLAASYGTNALIGVGLLLATLVARRHARAWMAMLAIAAVWLGSTLTYFGVFRPFHAHGPAVFLEGLFTAVFLLWARDPRHRLSWLALGAIAGLMVSVRPVTGMYVLAPLALLVWTVVRSVATARPEQRSARLRSAELAQSVVHAVVAGVLFLVGALIGRIPQIVFAGDWSLTGSSYYEDSGYLANGGGNPLGGLASLLFDGQQGALIMVPVIVLALVGLLGWWRRDRVVLASGAIWAIGIWMFVATLGYPKLFGGENLASRHLIEASPVYVLGIIGWIWLCGDAARAIARRVERLPGRAESIGAAVGAGVAVLLAGWGLLQHTSVQVVSNPVLLTPIERAAAIAERPIILGRLWLTAAASEPADGKVFLAGRLWLALTGRRGVVLREAILASVILLVLGVVMLLVVAGFLRLGGSTARRRASTAGPSRWLQHIPAALVWAPVVIIVGAVVLPAYLPPIDQGPAAQLVRQAWTEADSPAYAGRVSQVIVGESPFGNAILDPPAAEPPVDGPDPGFDVLSMATLDTEEGTSVQVPNDWRSLASVVIDVGSVAPGTELLVAVTRPGITAPAISNRLTADQVRPGLLEVQLPMRLPAGVSRSVQISLSIPTGAMTAAVNSDGTVAIRPRGVVGTTPAKVRIGETVVGAGPWLDVPMPAATSLRITDGARTRMRFGPWPVQTMLREATDGQGWRIPGPTTVPGTWNDSAVEDPDAGTPLTFRLDAPSPITSAMAYAISREEVEWSPGTISIEASADGTAWTVIATSATGDRQVRAHPGAFIPPSGTTTVWFRVEVASEGSSAGLNGVWFDLDLEGMSLPVSARVGDVVVDPPDEPAKPYRIDGQAQPSGVEARAREAATVIRDTMTGLRPAIALLVSLGALGVGVLCLVRNAGPVAAGAFALTVLFASIGVLGLPRVSTLGRTQSYVDGTATLAEVRRGSVTALADGATYVSPVITLQPGSRVTSVRASTIGEAASPEIRTVDSDGVAGPWSPAAQPIDVGRSEGVQIRVTLQNAGDRLYHLAVKSRPPIGRGAVPLIPSGYPRIGDPD